MRDKGRNAGPSPIDRQVQFEHRVDARIQAITKLVNEIVEKHNNIAANQVALEQGLKHVAGFTASEMGKFQGTATQHIGILGRSIEGIDMNVLALAEISKEIVGQLTQVDTIFKKLHAATSKFFANTHAGLNEDGKVRQMTNEDIAAFNDALELSEAEVANVKAEATEWYTNLVKSSFKTVQEKRAIAEKEAMEREAKEKAEAEAAAAEAEKAEQNKTEKETVEAELKAASDAERSVVSTKSGGPGAAFPDGADIFGG